MSKAQTIERRQGKLKQALLEQLRRTPIPEVACKAANTTRQTYYRLRRTSRGFAAAADAALADGRSLVCDVSESQLLSLIKQGKLEAIKYFLTHNSPRYANKLELGGSLGVALEPTPEQRKAIRRALRLARLTTKPHGRRRR